MTDQAPNLHHRACLQFADGVALMTRRQFGSAYQSLNAAHDAMLGLCRDRANADVLHVALFSTVVLLAAGQGERAAGDANQRAAMGMVKAWDGCKSCALGTDLYHRHGGLTPAALACYQQAVAHFAGAVALLEAGLGAGDPELYGPLGDYSGVLRAVGREADADRVLERALALPPKRLSAGMIGGGYPIITLDPFGTNPALPSQT
ncbi:MAG: hypothetical protein ABSG83_08975 [Roseiarcus sp.]|jgi:hypothetical protein